MAQYGDDFTRTVAAGDWGTSNSGHDYSFGASASHSVNGSQGIQNVTGANSPFAMVLDLSLLNPNVIALTEYPSIVGITGGYIFQEIFLRSDADSSNCYAITLFFDETEAGTLDIGTYIGGTYSLINFEPLPFSYTGVPIWVRCEATGTTIRAKAWEDGSPEPGTWLNSITNSTFTAAGQIGFYSNNESTNTNDPYNSAWDNIVANNTAESGAGNLGISVAITGDGRSTSVVGEAAAPFVASLTGDGEVLSATCYNQTVVDNFNDNVLDSAWSNFGGAQVQEVNEQIEITTLTSVGSWGLTRASVSFDQKWYGIRIVGDALAGGLTQQEVYPIQAFVDGNNSFYWFINGASGNISAFRNVGGVFTFIDAVPYDPDVHRYLAIGINENNELSWIYSSDGINFIEHATFANPFGTTDFNILIATAITSTAPGTTQFIFDDFSFWTYCTNQFEASPRLDKRFVSFDRNPVLDFAPHVGKRTENYTFQWVDGVTGQIYGYVHPRIDSVTLNHDTESSTKRTLDMWLDFRETALINIVRDRIKPFVEINGITYPLGKYMFTDNTENVKSEGTYGSYSLSDETFAIDTELDKGFSPKERAIPVIIRRLLAELPFIVTRIASSPFQALGSFGIGTSRLQVIETYQELGDYMPFWMDHDGVFRLIRTKDPAISIPDFSYDDNPSIVPGIAKTTDLLSKPNRYIVIGDTTSSDSIELVGRADIPASAPHSKNNRGFFVPKIIRMSVASLGQANVIARNLALRDTIIENLEFDTPIDPRHDSYNVVHMLGENWIEYSWSMNLRPGGLMHHSVRRYYR